MVFNRKGIPDEQLLDLYKSILKPRMIEEKMLILLRQGKISKWFSGIGQEAIAVGVSSAMEQEEYILPMHRNLGVFTTKGIPLNRLFSQFQGKMNGFTKGRDRSFHFGSQEHKVVGMISHLGPQLGVADGIALANKLKDNKLVTAVFTGEGGTSEGDFHEALNVAAVWDLPVIFIVENNGYGLSTPIYEQFRCQQIADKGKGFGMESYTIDGNNLLEVYRTISQLRLEIQKKPKPVLLECMTFRMRGHEEASGTKYVPQQKFDKWQDKDPVENYEQFLKSEKLLTNKLIEEIKTQINEEINNALDTAFAEEEITSNTQQELADMYSSFDFEEYPPASTNTTNIRMVDAISDALKQSMQKYHNTVVMGQDIAEYGGCLLYTSPSPRD